MPIIEDVIYADLIDVAYRASAEPQVLSVDIELHKKSERSWVQPMVDSWPHAPQMGLVGGSEFAPEAGLFELLATRPKPDPLGPRFGYDFRVAGVSPYFMRLLAELFIAGSSQVKALLFKGSLPLDDSSLSVSSKTLRSWLDSPTAYPGAWPDPGFEVREVNAVKGMTLKVHFGEPVGEDQVLAVEDIVSGWSYWASNHTNRAHDDTGLMQADHRVSKTKNEVRIGKSGFTYDPKPMRDLLANGLSFLHRSGEFRIEWIEIGMPGLAGP